MESILTSIKKLLGITEEDDSYDVDVITHINTYLFRLKQLNIGPKDGFSISDDGPTWADFLGEQKDYSAVKTYVYLKVKLVFDPPLSASVLEAMKEQAKELEWELNSEAETEV